MPEPEWVLDVIAEAPLAGLWSYRLRQVGLGRLQSTIVTFVDGEVVLSGDLAPGDGYCCSTSYGYGKDPRWFAGDFGTSGTKSYLCSKFLQNRFVEDAAVDAIRDALEHPGDHDLTDHQLEEIARTAECPPSFDCHCEWLEFLGGLGLYEPGDDPPGWTYDPTDSQTLIDIQARFSRLWRARMDELYKWTGMGLWTGAPVRIRADAWPASNAVVLGPEQERSCLRLGCAEIRPGDTWLQAIDSIEDGSIKAGAS